MMNVTIRYNRVTSLDIEKRNVMYIWTKKYQNTLIIYGKYSYVKEMTDNFDFDIWEANKRVRFENKQLHDIFYDHTLSL